MTEQPESAVEVKPCPNPWCGSTTAPIPVALKREGWRVACACGVATHRHGTEAEALADWNTRATQPAEAQRDTIRNEIINAPETADFMAGVPLEAAHQRERWGADHDAGKTPFDWFWLVGYLAQKAADAAVRGDIEKAMHHTISTAAALANWHAHLTGADTRMRPGIDPLERNVA